MLRWFRRRKLLCAVAGGQATYDAMSNGELDVMINRDSRVIAQAKTDGVQGYDYIVSSGWLFAPPRFDVLMPQKLGSLPVKPWQHSRGPTGTPSKRFTA